MNRLLRGVLPLVLLLALPASAGEPGTVDFELFRPQADVTGYFTVPSASTLRNLQMGLSLWAGYQNDPVVLELDGVRVGPSGPADGESGDALVDGRFRTDIQAALGITQYGSLAISLPVVLSQQGVDPATLGTDSPQNLQGAGLGDLVISPKFVPFSGPDRIFGLAVLVPVSLPTGPGTSFLGDDGLAVTPTVVLELSDASVQARQHGFRGAASVGYAVRGEDRLQDSRFGSAFEYGLAGGWRPAEAMELIAELHGEVGGGKTAQSPGEGLLGARIYAGEMVSLNLGGGLGLFSGMGAPDWRAFFGMSVAPDFDPSAKDADKDGLSDAVDACPERAEDLDSYQDKDGCPDLDNDLDKIPDDKDTCPNDPEDDDSFQDADGCPDADNDGDGVPDISDRCPLESETENGYQDDDGCPDSKPRGDSDNDRYTDDIDRCPNDPEDYDGFQDEDGCPDPDNDSDGIPDVSDRCKDMAETFDGVDDADGCPETRVQIQGTSIKISERIFFDTGRNTIQDRSHALLDEIASVIVAHPELKKIRIEGHTDNVGPDNNNLRLSQARAEAVRDYLVRKGVAPARLDARGFGEMYPLASNDTEAGRAENRRVEFIIAERD